MFDKKFLDDLAKQLSQAVPDSVRNIQKDLEKNFRAVLQSTFTKLDLVTRKEFDSQVKVLGRTRSKLEALEKQIAKLEKSQATKAKKSPKPNK